MASHVYLSNDVSQGVIGHQIKFCINIITELSIALADFTVTCSLLSKLQPSAIT